jgi:hypothetical protein
MGLKGYRLWDMGQLYSNVQSPTAGRLAVRADVQTLSGRQRLDPPPAVVRQRRHLRAEAVGAVT